MLEKGGEPIGFLGGVKGVPHAAAVPRRVGHDPPGRHPVAAGLPGRAPTAFPCSGRSPRRMAAALDVLQRAGLAGADLIACSMAGMLAADIAALSPATVRRLVLVRRGASMTSDGTCPPKWRRPSQHCCLPPPVGSPPPSNRRPAAIPWTGRSRVSGRSRRRPSCRGVRRPGPPQAHPRITQPTAHPLGQGDRMAPSMPSASPTASPARPRSSSFPAQSRVRDRHARDGRSSRAGVPGPEPRPTGASSGAW